MNARFVRPMAGSNLRISCDFPTPRAYSGHLTRLQAVQTRHRTMPRALNPHAQGMEIQTVDAAPRFLDYEDSYKG